MPALAHDPFRPKARSTIFVPGHPQIGPSYHPPLESHQFGSANVRHRVRQAAKLTQLPPAVIAVLVRFSGPEPDEHVHQDFVRFYAVPHERAQPGE